MIAKSNENETRSQAADEASDFSAEDVEHLAAALMAKSWMQNPNVDKARQTVSANELTSLSALIAYVAYNSGANEFRVERQLADRFNVPNVQCLPAAQFDDAIRYLVDQVE